MLVRRLRCVLVLSALLLPATAAQAASIWTPVNSGTTDTISSIVYQSSARLWYATTNGHIGYWNGSGFTAATGTVPTTDYNALAFQPGTAGGPGSAIYGYAVGSDGSILQSSNGGETWHSLARPSTYFDCSATSPVVAAENELNGVVWADANTAYLLGDHGTLLRSTNAASATPTFTEINKVHNAASLCAAQGDQTSPADFSDAAFAAGNPLHGYLVAKYFDQLYSSSDGFATSTRQSDIGDTYQGNPRIAVDQGNFSHLFIADHGPGGTGCGGACLPYSTNGGTAGAAPMFANDSHPLGALFGVSFVGGVEVAAGHQGEIFTSLDGQKVYNQPADGTQNGVLLASANWEAEDAADAAHAAVGGQNGVFAMTSAANTIPDIVAPTGAIVGPGTVNSRTPVTYSAFVGDNAGGSGINPASEVWSATGFPNQSGPHATYTFPRGIGSITLTLSFADNAGNTATATKTVFVNDPTLPPGGGGGSTPPSGSHGSTHSAGNSTVTLFKVVTVTGRHGRFVPVVVNTKKPRKFVITILTIRGKHHVATAYLTLRHGGKRTVHVNLSSKVKAGSYYIIVRVFSLKNHGLGRQIKQAFILV